MRKLSLSFIACLALGLALAPSAGAEPTFLDLLVPEEGAAAAPCAEDGLTAQLQVFASESASKGFLQCGGCSLSPCKFATQGTPCGTRGGHCWDVYGIESCSTSDYVPKCRCWVGDLP